MESLQNSLCGHLLAKYGSESIINRITIKQFAAVVESMVNGEPDTTDMEVLEGAINQVMKNNGLKFRDYTDLLNELMLEDEGYLLSAFNTVEEYFYDAINAQKISRDKIENLIAETIIF